MFKLFLSGLVLSLAGVSLAEPAPRRVAINITKQGFAPDRVTIREIAVTFHKTGELQYACAMDMVHGLVVSSSSMLVRLRLAARDGYITEEV